MQILIVDASPLVHIVDRPNMILLQNEDIFKAPDTEKKLETFNWEVYHKTKGELLKDIIHFLIKRVPQKQEDICFLVWLFLSLTQTIKVQKLHLSHFHASQKNRHKMT
jgi:hypothetical protein